MLIIFSIITLFDLIWIVLVWKDWWEKNLDHGLVWIKLQRLHSLGIVLNAAGVVLKSLIIFCITKADKQNHAEEIESDPLLSRHQNQ